ncbi:MAG: glycosyltransferase, partial [Anaerolineae bacterium]
MIVKNESQVIQRCLASVKNIVDYWVIVDTGSTDGTQKMIKEFMRGIPGELHERPWVNFSHNRNEVLVLSKNKGDYLLFIDADEELVFSKPFDKQVLDKDFYSVIVRQSGIVDSQRILLVNHALDWSWKGVLHEDILSSQAKKYEVLKDVINFHREGGRRSLDPKKYYQDAQILEKALEEDPTNTRYIFYLAESYAKVQEYSLALKNYEKRVGMGGWDQEVFWSLYNVGRMQENLQMDPQAIIKSYSKAFQYRPSRAEPLYRLANYYCRTENYLLGYLISKFALSIPLSSDPVNVEQWIYDYGVLFEFANCCYWLGNYAEARSACVQLLSNQNLPL